MSLAQEITRRYDGTWHGTYGTYPGEGHSKADRSVSVKDAPEKPEGIVINSFAGTDWRIEMDRLRKDGILKAFEPDAATPSWRCTGTYVYDDGGGNPVYRTRRLEATGAKKRFEAERWEAGQWVRGLGVAPRVLYRLGELRAAIGKAALTDNPLPTVYFVEGERKADKLAEMGFLATAIAFGANGWKDSYAADLAGCTVIILPDNDDTGRTFAARVQESVGKAGGHAHMVELPGLPDKGDVINWQGTADDLRALTDKALTGKVSPTSTITATPYQWCDPSTIPLRPWLWGRWILRRTVGTVIAPGGSGKTTFLAASALSWITGRDLLGKQVWGGPKKVWIWNLEDGRDDLQRSIQAAALHYGIGKSEVEGRLFLDIGMEDTPLCTAIEDHNGFKLLVPIYEAITAELIAREIDILVVDPFVSSHQIDENKNVLIDKIAKAWSQVSHKANCAIALVHHTSKAGAVIVSAHSSRGGVSLTDASRWALVINRMDEKEAKRLGIQPEERRRLFSVSDDKHNRAPAENADWFRLASVDLGNGCNGPGDSVGVAETFNLPDVFDDVSVRDLYDVQQVIASGDWAQSVQNAKWAGQAVAEVLGLDLNDEAEKMKVGRLLKTWIQNGALEVEKRFCPKKSRDVPFIVVGEMVDPSTLPTPLSGVGKVGKVG